MTVRAALRWWRTLRTLRPVQIYRRVWFRLHRPRIRRLPTPSRRNPVSTGVIGAFRPQSMIGADTFCFLNRQRSLSATRGWDDPDIERLWRYNLHYFDDLNAESSDQRSTWHVALFERWMREVLPDAHASGWEPYPTSLRIVNWIRWSLAGNLLSADALHSLAKQARWLSGRVEYHLQGNHLWTNAKALIFAGVFFDDAEAQRWLQLGLRILLRELSEQILADGGHFERSPMYHAIVLNDVLELVALSQAFPGVLPDESIAQWQECSPRMLHWLEVMTHPDGEIALFNDAAFGIAPRVEHLRAFAVRLGLDVSSRPPSVVSELAESGYVRANMGGATLIADVGDIGPEYLAGHAHADTLAFELSFDRHRCFVDGGTATYAVSRDRLIERGTSAHNTVTINGEDSSEVWSSFRVARRARPFGKRIQQTGDQVTLECSHDGYRRLRPACDHTRTWTFSRDSLRVDDRVTGRYKTATICYLLHPDIRAELYDASAGSLQLSDGRRIRFLARGAQVSLTKGIYRPGFNLRQPTQCIYLQLESETCSLMLSWDTP